MRLSEAPHRRLFRPEPLKASFSRVCQQHAQGSSADLFYWSALGVLKTDQCPSLFTTLYNQKNILPQWDRCQWLYPLQDGQTMWMKCTSSSLVSEALNAMTKRDEKKEKDEVETVWERERSKLWCCGSVWIWRPDDLCLQGRLALTVVSGKTGANLKLSGDPQPCNIKARAGTLCQENPQSSSSGLISRLQCKDPRSRLECLHSGWDFYPDIPAELGMLWEPRVDSMSQTNCVSLRREASYFCWCDRQCMS